MKNKKLRLDDFTDSQDAIRDYMYFNETNCHMHKARVLISSNGKILYNNIIQVIALIDTNNSVVELIGDAQLERDFHPRYTNEYQRFKFIRGTLLIQAEDIWGKGIEIDITGV